MRVIVEFFRRFLPYIRGHYLFFGIAISASLVVAVCSAGTAYLIEPLLDTLSGRVPRATPLFSFDEMAKDGKIALMMSLLIVGVYFGKAIGTYVQGYFMSYIGQNIVRQMRDRMLSHMLSLELGFFNKMRGGELIARITNDIGIIRAAVSNLITEFVREAATIVGLVVIVFYQSPKYAMIGLVIVPLAIIPLNLIIKAIKRYSRKIQEQNADITSKLNEIFNNVEVIKASNGEKLESEIFKAQNLKFFKTNMKSVLVGELTTPLMEFLGALLLAVIVYAVVRDIDSGELTAAQFASFVGALLYIFTPFKRLVNIYGQLQPAIVASDRIFEILSKTPQVSDGTATLQKPINSITLRDVSLHYSPEVAALKNISLDFAKNKITALVGKSGSGKSSMINLILRLYETDSGMICMNGQNIKDFTQKSVRDHMAVVTQRIFIFNDSILHNVAYGSEADEARAIEALKIAQAWDFVKELPQGIHTILDEFGTNLSGGQRQRIAIARAIYKDPEVLIFDEATSALDSQTEEAFKESIKQLCKDKIIIIIAHRPSTIELAHEVVHMRLGEIIKVETQSSHAG